MVKIKLDKKDREILYELDLDSRQSDLEIARKLNLSREVVSYRIKKLIERGIIKEFYAVIDPTKFGFLYYKIYLQFQYLTEEKEKEVIDFFLNQPTLQRLVSCSGRWDMVIGLWTKDIHEFNKIFMNFSFKYGQYVMNKAFTITLRVSHYRRDYLIDCKGKHSTIAHFTGRGGASVVKLNEIDTKILRVLSEDARISATEISERIKISPRVIRYRIKKLKNEGVIQTFRSDLDLSKIGYIFLKAFFYLQNISEEKIKKFVHHCASLPNIVWVINCIGPWDIEVDFEIDSIEKFNNSMKDIKEKFGDIIRNVESVVIVADHGKGPRYFSESYSL